MQQPNIKTKTATGKDIAHYTMFVQYKPEFYRVNPETGEVKTKWTYRDDIEADKFAEDGIYYDDPLKVLGAIFNRDRHKYLEAIMYNNYLPPGKQKRAWIVGDKIRIPNTAAGRKKFNQWLKEIF